MQYAKPTDSGCHEWQSRVRYDGYGAFWFEQKQSLAHRAAYKLFVGDPGELRVLHRCDNRRCVNPEHLFLGTDQDNVRDMWSKGRGVGRRKVSDEMVARIKALRSSGESQQSIADSIGVSQITVSRILRGQRLFLAKPLRKGNQA